MKKYKSTSRTFQLIYTSSIVIVALIIGLLSNDIKHDLINIALFVPLIGLGFIFKTYYKIKGQKIYRWDIGGKDESPNFEIFIPSITVIKTIKRQGKISKIKLYGQSTKDPLATIQIEEFSEFIGRLLELNPSISVKE